MDFKWEEITPISKAFLLSWVEIIVQRYMLREEILLQSIEEGNKGAGKNTIWRLKGFLIKSEIAQLSKSFVVHVLHTMMFSSIKLIKFEF